MPDDGATKRRAEVEMSAYDALPRAVRAWLNDNGLPAVLAQQLWHRFPQESGVIAMLEQAKAQVLAGAKNITVTPPQLIRIVNTTASTSTTVRYW